jgi:hypothetical protein
MTPSTCLHSSSGPNSVPKFFIPFRFQEAKCATQYRDRIVGAMQGANLQRLHDPAVCDVVTRSVPRQAQLRTFLVRNIASELCERCISKRILRRSLPNVLSERGKTVPRQAIKDGLLLQSRELTL